MIVEGNMSGRITAHNVEGGVTQHADFLFQFAFKLIPLSACLLEYHFESKMELRSRQNCLN